MKEGGGGRVRTGWKWVWVSVEFLTINHQLIHTRPKTYVIPEWVGFKSYQTHVLIIRSLNFNNISLFYSGFDPNQPKLTTLSFIFASSYHTVGWIQVNLGSVFIIKAIQTRGNNGLDGATEFIRSYKISLSTTDANSLSWVWENDAIKVFIGNVDGNTIKTSWLPLERPAKHVRLTAVTANAWDSLRWEIRGCPHP